MTPYASRIATGSLNNANRDVLRDLKTVRWPPKLANLYALLGKLRLFLLRRFSGGGGNYAANYLGLFDPE